MKKSNLIMRDTVLELEGKSYKMLSITVDGPGNRLTIETPEGTCTIDGWHFITGNEYSEQILTSGEVKWVGAETH